MKILMLNYEYPPLGGGAGNAMHYLLSELSKEKNIQVDVVTSSPDKYSVENFSDNITVYKLDVKKKNHNYQTFVETFFWSVKTYFFTKDLLLRKYDLCHAWFGWPSGFFGYLNRKKMPYVVSLRGSDVPGFNPRFKILDKVLFNWLSRKIWQKAGYVTANSDGLRELAHKTWKGDIKIIYNGVDTVEFFPDKKKHKEIILLCVARLIKRKGIVYLIKAMPKLLSKNKKTKLIIIGDGPEKEYLENMSIDLKIEKSVQSIGKIEHGSLAKIYQRADIFLLPSLHEGMSNTILEAMASGLPIITTDTGGTKELIKGNGIIVKQENSIEIADAVIKLFDIKKREEFGAKSRVIAETLSWQNMSKKYVELYKKVLR